MEILLDENLPGSWVDYFAKHGFSVVSWKDVGEIGAPDSTILAWAKRRNAIVMTQDLDFGQLMVEMGPSCPSVILLRVDLPHPSVHGDKVLFVLKEHSDSIEQGAFVTVSEAKARVRILPFLD